MKWLEVIELRTVGGDQELLESQLLTLIDEVNEAAQEQTFKSYRSEIVDTDFRIHLFHESKRTENRSNQLGLRLTSALREFGLVNHSVWIEMESETPHGPEGRELDDTENPRLTTARKGRTDKRRDFK